jgi:hypothetical protein
VFPRRLLSGCLASFAIWACAKAQDEIGADQDATSSGSSSSNTGSTSVTSATSSSNTSSSGSGGSSSTSVGAAGGGGQAGESPTASNSSGSGGSGGIPQEVLDNAQVVVEYKVNGAGAAESSNQIFAHFYLRNQSTDALPLETAELRYWFDPDGLGYMTNSYHSGSDVEPVTLAAGNDGEFDYMGVTFTSSARLPTNNDLNASEIQMTLMSSGGNFDQSNDYSFSPGFVAQAPHDRVTFYLSGTLIWGCEPSGACASDAMGQAGAGSDN